MTARGRTTLEEACGRQGHDEQVSSYGDRGKSRRDGQGENEAESKGWSGKSEGK